MTSTRRSSGSGVARIIHRLAVLQAAGIPPDNAWRYVGQREDGAPGFGSRASVRRTADDIDRQILDHVVRRIGEGSAVAESILDGVADVRRSSPAPETRVLEPWLALAAAWLVATECGAPLASTLRSFSVVCREHAQAQRRAAVALAGPRATARLVMFLPLVGIVFGGVLGFNTLATLFATPPGLGCLAVATILMLLARRWNRALVRRATASGRIAGLRHDLMAVALAGGVAVDRARTCVDSALEQCSISEGENAGAEESAEERAGDHESDGDIDDVISMAERAGVPAAELLRGEAEELRREQASTAQERAEELAVRLVLPLGLCVMPAFLAVGVLPLVIAIVGSTVTGL